MGKHEDILLIRIDERVQTLVKNQAVIMHDQTAFKKEVREDIEELKRKNAFNKGFIGAITLMGGALGYLAATAMKAIFSVMH